jgi:peptidoglycan/xylan/chitin deacetylase (PgdA/CDA1 family)
MQTRHIALVFGGVRRLVDALSVLAFVTALIAPAPLRAQAPILATLSGPVDTSVEPTLDREPAEPAPEHDALASDLHDGRITRGFVDHRVLHFTFDDGPRPSTTRRLLDELDEYGVHATFFVVARQLEGRHHEAQRETVREIARRGHTIGSHTYDHTNLTTLDEAHITLEMTRSEAIFEDVLGDRPWLVRPPYGARNEHVDHVLTARGYTTVLWNLTAADSSSRDADTLVSTFRASLDTQQRHPHGPGGIVLLHDTHEWVIEAFPRMMDEVRARNCEIIDRGGDEELWDVVGDPRVFYQARDGERPQHASTVHLDEDLVTVRQVELRAEAASYCR